MIFVNEFFLFIYIYNLIQFNITLQRRHFYEQKNSSRSVVKEGYSRIIRNTFTRILRISLLIITLLSLVVSSFLTYVLATKDVEASVELYTE